jgi:hypothetical protein
MRAVSIGPLGTVSGGIEGAAVSGLVNVDGPVCGAEVAGLVNVAPSVQGVQIAGIVGVASKDSAGLQLSLVNVAGGRLHGVQLGLVNVASDADVQIGLVNVDTHGRLLLDALAKPEAGMLLAGTKQGPPHFHTLYTAEINVVSGRPWVVFGLGTHLTPSRRLCVDLDLLQHTQLVATTSSPNQISELRATVGYAFAPHFSAFVGPTFNVLAAPNLSRADAPGYAWAVADSGSIAIRAWPGVAFGLEGL